jgi:hypothetical protein
MEYFRLIALLEYINLFLIQDELCRNNIYVYIVVMEIMCLNKFIWKWEMQAVAKYCLPTS